MSRSLNNFDDRSNEVQPSDFVVGYRPGSKGARFQLSSLVAWIQSQFAGVFAASNHGHQAASITDSTATGRAVLTAANQAAGLSAIGAAAAVHVHGPTDLSRGTATDGQVLMWSDTAGAWVPTSISAISSTQVLDEDGYRLLDEDDALILDEG